MKIEFRKKFLTELAGVTSETRVGIEQFVFDEFPSNPSLTAWKNIIPLKGDPAHFKIPFDEYRIGISVEKNVVIFERVRHYHDIYRITTG